MQTPNRKSTVREVLWAPASGLGLEHLRLAVPAEGGAVADGLIIGFEQRPFRARYEIRCDERWRVRSLGVEVLDSGRPPLRLTADGAGRWTTADGTPFPALDGCIDVDLTASPFTNTLPVRRLGLAPGRAAEVRVAYVGVPELSVTVDPQRYTCLATGPEGSRYRFDALASDFTAELSLDADGLVVAYPSLFRRVWAR
jgi:uncharacterized protein